MTKLKLVTKKLFHERGKHKRLLSIYKKYNINLSLIGNAQFKISYIMK